MSFYTALSGLKAFNEQLSVISNNLSNSETTSYKSNSVSFADVIANTTTTSSSDNTGIGVSIQGTTTNWDQGTLSDTGTSTDMAISGSGFFVLTDSSGTTYYTRDGSLEYNAANTLVSSEGYDVRAYTLNDDGSLGTISNVTIPQSIAATSTTDMTLTANLDSATTTGDTYSASITCYDSLGNSVDVTTTFTKSSTSNQWTWSASIPSDAGSASGSGTVTFDSNGDLESGTNPTITLTLTNGASSPQTITWGLYDSSGNTKGNLTQYSSSSNLSNTSQDGTAAGQLKSVTTDSSGIISATYSNGITKDLYKIALADFSNYNGLNSVGDNLYKETTASGNAVLGTAGSNQFGTISSGSLEGSNVDLASDLSSMIIAERAYEACSKMITTESDMLQTIIKMVS